MQDIRPKIISNVNIEKFSLPVTCHHLFIQSLGNDTAVLCANFEASEQIKTDVMDGQELTRFETDGRVVVMNFILFIFS